MYEIDFHADDYAASVGNSKRLLTLLQAGKVDSLSIITNMGCYGECMRLLRESWELLPKKPLLSVHINLIDGYRLSDPEKKQIIQNSWGWLFFHSFLPGRKQMLHTCSAEIEAQINAFLAETKILKDDGGNQLQLRIDGHVHTHMIPLVFEALMDALKRMNLQNQVRFIRCSTEPLAMFLFTPGVAGTISPVSILKNLTLHLLSHTIRRKLVRMNIPTGRIFGLAMTGEMDLRRVRLLLPQMKKYAKRKNAYMEIMSHPGRVSETELAPEYGPDDQKAFLSPKRDVEYQMLMELPRNDV